MLLGHLDNAQGQLVHALGQNHRGVVLIGIIAQGYSKVGGVTDDHIGAGHLLHHTLLGPPALNLLDLALHLGIALSLLIFLLDLLFGHLQLPLIVPPLIEVVEEGQNGEGYGNTQHQGEGVLE